MDVKDRVVSVKDWIYQGAVITPHLSWYAVYNVTANLEKLYPGCGFPFLITFFEKQGDLGVWTFGKETTFQTAEKLIKDPALIKKAFKLWLAKKAAFQKYLDKLEKNGISDLLKDYLEFKKSYCEEYAAAFFTEYLTLLSDSIIVELQKKYSNKDAFQKLSLPVKKVFMIEEHLSALKIGFDLKKNKMEDKSYDYIKKNQPKIAEKIKQHQKHFFWTEGNYKYTEPITEEGFFKKILESVQSRDAEQIKERISFFENYEKNREKENRELVKKLNISKQDSEILEMVQLNAYWHDTRKKYNLMGNYWVNEFLELAGKQLRLSKLELQFTLPQEFISLLKGEFDSSVLKERVKACVHVVSSSGEDYILTGKDFEEYKKIILGKREKKQIDDFRGTSACYGVVRGYVKIIHNAKKEDIKDNEILVASMTRPEFLPLMKKSKGIITDEGGITSHAAIISRELNKPCVVGTLIATKVLKDGDYIELNANHGIIKKVNEENKKS
jgi:phosphohistidine swiveling domain-containing protein